MDRLDALPRQAPIVRAFAGAFGEREDVVAAFVGGSIGARRADELSDVDLVVVYAAEEAREAAWQERQQVFALLGEVLFVADADHVGPHLQVGAVAGPVLVDLAYRLRSDLEPGWWYHDILVIRDDDGFMEGVQAASRRIERGRLDAEQLVNLTRKFWRWALYTARDIARGEPLEVLADIDFIRRNALLPLAATAAGLPTDRIYRFDRLGPAELLPFVHAGHVRSLERPDLEAALQGVVDSFLALRDLAGEKTPHDPDVSDEVGKAALGRMLAPEHLT